MDLTARIEAAKAAKLEAEEAISKEDRVEITAREELAKIEAEERTLAREARTLDLARRMDAAQDRLGADVELRAIDMEEIVRGGGTYIVKAPPLDKGGNPSVFRAARKNLSDPKSDHDMAHRQFSAACVVDFNGHDDLGGATGEAMIALWKRLTGVPIAIFNVCTELAGAADVRRKSDG